MVFLLPGNTIFADMTLFKKEYRLRLRYMSVQSTWYMKMLF